MRMRYLLLQFILPAVCVLAIFLFSGCVASNELPALVAEAYIEALANKDLGRMVQASCGSFHTEARAEFDMYAALETRLETLDCRVVDINGSSATVMCSGALVVADGVEARPVPLDGLAFYLTREDRMWKICEVASLGTQSP